MTAVSTRPASDARAMAVRETLDALVEAIPEPSGDGTGILADILDADSAVDLIDVTQGGNALPKLEQFYGKDIRVNNLTRIASDYSEQEESYPWYLIVDGVINHTDEPVQFSVGAMQPIAVLAKLWDRNALPAVVQFSQAEKKTARGFRPKNCTVLAVTNNP